MAGIRLEWAQFGDFDSFEVIRSDTSMASVADADLPSPIASNLKTMYFVDTTVTVGNTYYYKVRAWRDGVGVVSTEIKTVATAYENAVAVLLFDSDFSDLTGKTWTVSNVSIDSDSAVFGGSGYLVSQDSSDFSYGTGDFEWNIELSLSSTGGNQYILDHGLGNSGTLSYHQNSLKYYNPSTGVGSPLYTTSIPLDVNTTYNVKVKRESGITSIYVDNVVKVTASDPCNYTATKMWLGRYGDGGYNLNGKVSKLIIKKY